MNTNKPDTWDNLSDEAKEAAKSMIEFCINNGYCMGMDEGFIDFEQEHKHRFREELELFSGYK